VGDANLSYSSGTYTLENTDIKNVCYIGIKKSALADADANFCVHWSGNGMTSEECMDNDGTDDTDEYYSFPASL
jgi:hypothetical protein